MKPKTILGITLIVSAIIILALLATGYKFPSITVGQLKVF